MASYHDWEESLRRRGPLLFDWWALLAWFGAGIVVGCIAVTVW